MQEHLTKAGTTTKANLSPPAENVKRKGLNYIVFPKIIFIQQFIIAVDSLSKSYPKKVADLLLFKTRKVIFRAKAPQSNKSNNENAAVGVIFGTVRIFNHRIRRQLTISKEVRLLLVKFCCVSVRPSKVKYLANII